VTRSLLFMIGLIATSSVALGQAGGSSEAKAVVVVSVEPLALVIRELCADACEVMTLVPKGVSEHAWQPGPKDVMRAKKAKVAVAIGLGFDEAWFDKIGFDKRRVVWLGQRLDPQPWWSDHMLDPPSDHHNHHHKGLKTALKDAEHDHNHKMLAKDPHVWVDAGRMSMAVLEVGTHLDQAMPTQASLFQSRSRTLAERFLKLQQQVEQRRKGWKTRPVVMFHDVAGYFGRRFNLPVLSVLAGGGGHDLSAKMIADIARRFSKASVAAILVERDDGAAKSLARELKTQVKIVDFGATKSYATWDEWYLHVASSWEDVLK
jgi:zinc transport system substrate-binding protein